MHDTEVNASELLENIEEMLPRYWWYNVDHEQMIVIETPVSKGLRSIYKNQTSHDLLH